MSPGKPDPNRRKPGQQRKPTSGQRPADRGSNRQRPVSEHRQAQQKSGAEKRASAQQRLAAERAAAVTARAAAERRRRLRLALVPVAVVIVVVVAFIAVKAISGSGPKSGKKSQEAASAVIKDVTGVPEAAFNVVSAGSIQTPPKKIDGTLPPVDGKQRILYVGAEYCPFCAAERWAMVVALSRFGTFTNLGQTSSAPAPESYPNTSTLSFHGSTFTSTIVSFTGVETETNQVKNGSYTKLDSLSAADEKIFKKYDYAPYVSSDSGGSIPFVLIGGKYLISGSSYDPTVLQGKTHAEIASALKDANTDISKAIVGTANVITAAICAVTGGKPAAVCTSAGVIAGKAKLDSAS
ncbi:MAG: DUF929 family protein [Jatrophihabitans sp.]